jgi:hypothetical protein
MLYIFRLFLFLINIDQKTVLNWFGIQDPSNQNIFKEIENGYDLNSFNFEPSPNLSLNTLKLIVEGLWGKIQDGLTFDDIENVLFFILFIRFIILAYRYNLKTSFYITCIGAFAGYLWYRHLIDLVYMYRNVLITIPFVNKLGIDAVQLSSTQRQMMLNDLKLREHVHWYNPGQVLYYAFTKGIINIDPETGLRYYIDPISMILSKLPESIKSSVIPLYYKIYNNLIPTIFKTCSDFSSQLSGLATYAVITRIGKRYCPYLIRWHWTFILTIDIVKSIVISFIYRISYFQTFVLIPQANLLEIGNNYTYVDPNVVFKNYILNAIIICIVLSHIGFVIFALLHAIWGQYFYMPFLVENTELHIGPRPTSSIYSGGQTAWQDPKEKNLNQLLPKLWYGWFGRGTKNRWNLTDSLKRLFKTFLKLIKKLFQGF